MEHRNTRPEQSGRDTPRNGKPWRYLYGRRWRAARLEHLARSPLCVFCEAVGVVTPATVVDHIERHNGDPVRFWDRTNWQSLCQPCHDGTKQRQEKQEERAPEPCGLDGYPTNSDW